MVGRVIWLVRVRLSDQVSLGALLRGCRFRRVGGSVYEMLGLSSMIAVCSVAPSLSPEERSVVWRDNALSGIAYLLAMK